MEQPGSARNTQAGDEPSIAILGAGMSGLCMAVALRKAGHRRFVIYEKAGRAGGTWRDNTYPGVACDVPSHLYSFSFAPNADWTRKYSPGAEIQAYCERCAQQFGLLPHIRFDTEITHARFDGGRWRLRDRAGASHEADFLISGLGGLHHPAMPDIPGMADFAGHAFHSARWDHAHALEGRKVAIVGSAASAVQIVPAIAGKVARLEVFQRTPNWILPRRDRAYSRWFRAAMRKIPGLARMYRWLLYATLESRWPAFRRDLPINALARRYALWQLRRAVPDPDLRQRVTPDYPPGCKRILLSDDFFSALQSDNVDLVDTGIARIEAAGIVTTDGRLHEADTIVYATGFQVFDISTGTDIVGRDGFSLAQRWRDGIAAHRSLTVPGFPNFFMLLGPNSGLGHNSVIFMIEAQVRYVSACLRELRARGLGRIEAREEALSRFETRLHADMGKTIWKAGCRSWYQDARGEVFTLWPHSTVRFWREMRRPDFSEYRLSP